MTGPSRGDQSTRKRHPCQEMSRPSTVKLGPSGCSTTSGFRSVRCPLELPDVVVSTGGMPVSTKSTTLRLFMSIVTTTPSIGRSYGFGKAPR